MKKLKSRPNTTELLLKFYVLKFGNPEYVFSIIPQKESSIILITRVQSKGKSQLED